MSRLLRYVTLYGWSGLYQIHHVMGASGKRKCIHPSLTSGLNNFAFSPHDSAKNLLLQQTIAPVYMYFVPAHRDAIQRAMLCGDSSRALKSCQFPASGCGSSLVLKSCSHCAVRDMQLYGVAYWHRRHQIPGVTTCSEHSILLQTARLQTRQRLAAGLLPEVIVSTRSGCNTDILYSRFCRDVLELTSLGKLNVAPATLYRRQLQIAGYVTAQGRVRHKELMKVFYHDMQSSVLFGSSALPSGTEQYGYLYHLLNSGFSVHPVRHLLFSFWLFNNGQAMYGNSDLKRQTFPEAPSGWDKSNVVYNIHDIGDLFISGLSFNKVSTITGKSRCYLKRIVATLNIPVASGVIPKKITSELKSKVLFLGRAGFHRKVIAERCGISQGSVEQIFSACDGLVEHRRRCHYQSTFRRYKCCILRYRQCHPDAIRKEIKLSCNAAFFWLYNHNKDALESILPVAIRPAGCKR